MTGMSLSLELFRLALDGGELNEEIQKELTPENMAEIYKISKVHDLAHLIGELLVRAQLDNTPFAKPFLSAKNMASYRYVQNSYEFEQICLAFDEEKIPYMPLKGAIVRKYYPEPWMRTSCDIDILVRNEDLARAGEVLKSKLNYTFAERALHDVSYYSPSGVHLELHFDLTELNENVQNAVQNIWESATQQDNSYCFAMTNEMFVAYHIAHMAGHFRYGGCGIRPFLDLWLLKNKMPYDKVETERLLAEFGLTEFAKNAFLLSDIWFDNAKHTEVTRDLEEYIVGAGVYGSLENKVAVLQDEKKGGFRYVLSRIFLPYKKMKRLYPKLEKAPILLPFYHVKRWLLFLFKKDKKRALAELKYSSSISDEKKERIATLRKNLGLK